MLPGQPVFKLGLQQLKSYLSFIIIQELAETPYRKGFQEEKNFRMFLSNGITNPY
jgi:hypothetical protein